MDAFMGFLLLFGLCFLCYRFIRFMIFGIEPSKARKEEIEQQQKANLEYFEKLRSNCRKKVEVQSEKYRKELSLLRSQLVLKDEFNHYILCDWERKVRYFLSTVVKIDEDIRYGIISFEEAFKIVNNIALKGQKELARITYSETMTGVQYEHLCGTLLERKGWKIKYTKGSGDQGADIIATKNNVSLAIQCKRYKKAVGNKAIQEIVAGRQFYNATHAIVIAPNDFTKSAKQLAQKTNVLLLNHQSLEDIHKYIP